jgi:uncharacterized membrane protein
MQTGSVHRRVAAGLPVAVVLGVTVVTVGLGAAVKAPCASGDWRDGRQYRRLCYSDIVPLYGTEQLAAGRLPFLDRCSSGAEQCDEYPVLTMYFMRAAASAAQAVSRAVGTMPSYAGFFWANAFLLAICALATTWALWRVVGDRALYFGAAPTLLIYGFVNWDLFAVALATAGTLAFLRHREARSGTLLGLGTAAKLFPALLVVPFGAARLRERRPRKAAALAGAAVIAWLVVDGPFAVLARGPWGTFFRFNATRPVDWDSLWFAACQRLHGGVACSWSPRVIDGLSAGLFVGSVALVWWRRRAREPRFQRWTLGFPVLVLFLLTSKVYSPQYGLWLLPWFALVLPDLTLFLAFEATDVAVFLTRFTWFGRYARDLGGDAFQGFHGAPLGAFELAVVARAAVLLACVAMWVMGRRAPEPTPVPTAAAVGTARGARGRGADETMSR